MIFLRTIFFLFARDSTRWRIQGPVYEKASRLRGKGGRYNMWGALPYRRAVDIYPVLARAKPGAARHGRRT